MMIGVYQSTDAGAPTLSGSLGDLITVLNQCLVTGYGSGDEAKLPLGWQQESSTNGQLAAFTPSDLSAGGHTLLIDDSGPGAGGAKFARAWGIQAGAWLGFDGDVPNYTVGQEFPSTAQSSFGMEWAKSSIASSTSRPWILIGDHRTFYFWVCWTGSNFTATNPDAAFHAFGDLETFDITKQGLAIHCANMRLENSFFTSSTGDYWRGGHTLEPTTALTKDNASGATSQQALFNLPLSRYENRNSNITGLGAQASANSMPSYPINTQGGTLFEDVPVFTGYSPQQFQGRYRGVIAPGHHDPLPHGDELMGISGDPARSYKVIRCSTGNRTGSMLVDITGPWL